MKKIAFILDHQLHHYRVPFFTALSDYYDIVIFHRGPEVHGLHNFKQFIVDFKKLGPFELMRNAPNLNGFDAVVIMQNIRIINLYYLPLITKNSSLLLWGIGTSSSKGLGSESKLSVFFRNVITLMYQGLALYSPIPTPNYWMKNKRKISVVGNSIVNDKASNLNTQKKDYFLFIGSLNKRKGLNELLDAFKQATLIQPNLHLKVIGDGPEKAAIEKKTLELELTNNVQLLGAIYGSDEKKRVFKNAYCVISPLQAGLSVVESFSYGIPFVTSSTAITGGESYSIISEENGVFFNNISELPDIICSFVDGRRDSSYLGNNAYKYYQENLDFKIYVNRFKIFIDKYI